VTAPLTVRMMAAASHVAHRLGRFPTPEEIADIPVARRLAHRPARWMQKPLPRGVEHQDRMIPGRSGPVRVRTYRRTGSTSAAGVLYVHGGGFVFGGLDGCHNICMDIAARTGAAVVSVDYRLAPDHAFPSGLEDCHDALLWFVECSAALGVDPAAIAVVGDSAGGNLCAALCLVLRDGGGPRVAGQVLIYPLLDFDFEGESWTTRAAPWMNRELAIAMRGHYLATADPRNPLASPVRAADLSGLPPALVVTAERDTLRDDGVLYARLLASAGVDVRHTDYRGAPHGFLSVSRMAPMAEVAFAEIAHEIMRRSSCSAA
jgi:acetyl esterase